ncbi:MAG: hypothetical protein ACXVCN_15750 [Bdellovibrio sp.]
MKKHISIFTLIMAFSGASQALVSDHFLCTLKIEDFVSKESTEQQQDLFITRIPLNSSPAADVRITAGQTTTALTLDTRNAVVTANVNFYYKHAVKTDASGNLLEARQTTCVGITGHYCETSKEDPHHSCATSSIACLVSQDPFNPLTGWGSVSIIDGIPTFNEKGLGLATATLSNNGVQAGIISFDCKYAGTYQ